MMGLDSRRIKYGVILFVLNMLYWSRLHVLMSAFYGGVGVILMFHRVTPGQNRSSFSPSSHLSIDPVFFEQLLQRLQQDGWEFVTLKEVLNRLLTGQFQKRFVALTFDDGYRDNLMYALPICRKYNAPITISVVSDCAEGKGVLLWDVLEYLIAENDHLEVLWHGQVRVFKTRTTDEKYGAYDEILTAVFRMDAVARREWIAWFDYRYDLDAVAMSNQWTLNWKELKQMFATDMVDIAAHTVTHPNLAAQNNQEMQDEMALSRQVIEERLGCKVSNFCYPIGGAEECGPREFVQCRDFGFASGYTTRHGMIFPEHKNYLHCLPRISVNGHFQSLRYMEVLLSGTVNALTNRFRRVVTT